MRTSEKQPESPKSFLNDKLLLFCFQFASLPLHYQFHVLCALGCPVFSLNHSVNFLNYVFATMSVVILPTALPWQTSQLIPSAVFTISTQFLTIEIMQGGPYVAGTLCPCHQISSLQRKQKT